MAIAKLMTNLLPQYYYFLQGEAKRQKKTMRHILEEAIAFYAKEKKKEIIRKQYKIMKNDEEYNKEHQLLAEAGMKYFLMDLKHADGA